ncbi:MAG: Tm-1-like ATP-binding domain-containing protein [Armatimonadota bacterium]|nr:Tm-1-like ATP-binding domain-containing protein [Armatimonadota bacterium]MDR7485979.1 Tm-1-like ATP-binding domain-containing protein [Armatimonadota bacterium]MDR7534338.1 Tm-1-like ATP-binding domain-containing protein [Armatimonadota bacterium]MDR7536902.1 Tm-1-like ATP-binding domain-containing protein [Armatimonadota bacterium]
MVAVPVVAILATLDTKEAEARFLARWFHRHGCEARLVDTALPQPGHWTVTRDRLIAEAGQRAAQVLEAWATAGGLHGVLGLGGNQGAAIAAIAMRGLPARLPKVLVSTVAARNLTPHLAGTEVEVVFSVGDLLGGPNRVTWPPLVRAAAALAARLGVPASDEVEPLPSAAPAVALTTLGNTQTAAARIMARLRGAGYDVIPFHASGAGGSAMEALVARGDFAGVVDLATHELLGEVFPEDIYAPEAPGRLRAAAEAGLPLAVAPGGLDYFVFGPPESVPPAFRGRPACAHNPFNTNVRATAGDLRRVAVILAERLNAARGPTAFYYPRQGWSEVGALGGPLWDAEANEAFWTTLRSHLGPGVPCVDVDAAINAPAFADAVADGFLRLAGLPPRTEAGPHAPLPEEAR